MELKNIKVDEINETKTNPRGNDFEDKNFDELTKSIEEKGVLMPILVRPIKKGKFEVVAGSRRLKVAKKIGLKEIPVKVLEMNDIEAREAQIVENLQRQDVHPLDEGEAYRKLIEEAKYEISAVAAKVAKSESYVKQRLFLTNLKWRAVKAYRTGKINDGHAILIAKLSSNDQKSALQATLRWNEVMTVKELKDWIETNIYSEIAFQPWLKSKEAMEAVGECTECKPNSESLFGPVKEGACTDLKCWKNKIKKYFGWKVKMGKLKRISSEYGQAPKGVISLSDYVKVGRKKEDRCDSVLKAIVVEGSGLGKEIDICINPKCEKHKGAQTQYGLTAKEIKERKEDRKKEIEATKKAKVAIEKRLADALEKIKWPLSENNLELLLSLSLSIASSNLERSIAKRHELEVKKEKQEWGGHYYEYDKAIEKMVKGLDKKEKLKLVFELLIDDGYGGLNAGFKKLK